MDVSGIGVVDGRKGGAALRQRPAVWRRGEQRQIPGGARLPRCGLAGGRDPWRLRLRQGISCRAPLPRSRADAACPDHRAADYRSEEHTSELQSLMRITYAVFCLKKTNKIQQTYRIK